MKNFFKPFILFLNLFSFCCVFFFHDNMTLTFSFDGHATEYHIFFFIVPLFLFSILSVFYSDKINVYWKILIALVKTLIPVSLLAFHMLVLKLYKSNSDQYSVYDIIVINAKYNLEQKTQYLSSLLEKADINISNYPEFTNVVRHGAERYKKMSQIEDFAKETIERVSGELKLRLVEKTYFDQIIHILTSPEIITSVIALIVFGSFAILVYEYQTTKQNYLFGASEKQIEKASEHQIRVTADLRDEAENVYKSSLAQLRHVHELEGRRRNLSGLVLERYIDFKSVRDRIRLSSERDDAYLSAIVQGFRSFKDYLIMERAKLKSLTLKDTLSESFKTMYNTIKEWF